MQLFLFSECKKKTAVRLSFVMFEEKLFYFPVYWPRKKMAPELTSVMA